MIHTALFLAGMVLPSLSQQTPYPTDTTVPVERGARLRVKTMGGDITVRTWDRNQLRIEADHSRRTEIEVERSGSVVDVVARGSFGMAGVVDYRITAPSWMALELGGMNATVSVEGTRAAVRAESIQGDITVRGGAESITLSTANGRIEVSDARGRLDLRAVSGGILVRNAEGDVVAESVSGDVELLDVVARTVEAQSVSGDLVLTGRIADGGTYGLFTHSGDITLGIPEQSNALLTLSSSNGDFRFDYDLRAERTTRRRQTFRMGSGSATVELETFSGDIRVTRPGVRSDRRDDRNPQNDRRRPDGWGVDDPPTGDER